MKTLKQSLDIKKSLLESYFVYQKRLKKQENAMVLKSYTWEG